MQAHLITGLLLGISAGVGCGERPSPVPSISIEIEPSDMTRLREQRDAAAALGILYKSGDDYVPASLRADGDVFPGEVRLKGDLSDHFRGSAYSLRVRFEEAHRLWGMRRFSLNVPFARGFHREVLFLDYLRERGILTPRAFFVGLRVNRELFGPMLLEEHFSRELPEAQQRPRGVILKFVEDEHWKAWELTGFSKWTPEFDNFRTVRMEAFQASALARTSGRRRDRDAAMGLLRAFMDSTLQTSQIMDVELWGRMFAACELFSAYHMMDWRNIRFYYNPVTGLLEPVAFDTGARPGRVPEGKFHCQGWQLALADELLADREIHAAFVRNLVALSEEIVTPEFQRALARSERGYFSVFEAVEDVPDHFELDALVKRAETFLAARDGGFESFARRPARPSAPMGKDVDYPAVILATHWLEGEELVVDLTNRLSRPVEILWVGDRQGELPATGAIDLPLKVRPSIFRALAGRAQMRFPIWPGVLEDGIVGDVRVLGGKRTYRFASERGVAPRREPVVPTARLEEALASHPFLGVESGTTGWLTVRPGTWAVAGWLIVPPGLGLRIGPGTTLRFSSGTGLVASGPLELTGAPEAPIVLESSMPGAGAWAGIAVPSSAVAHRWQHVVVRDTAGVEHGSWRLAAGVTLRGAPVFFEAVHVEGSRAAVAVDLIHADVTLREVVVRDAVKDGLRIAHGSGRSYGGKVLGAGDEAIVIEGSSVEFDEMEVRQPGDKAFLIAADSRVRLRGVEVLGGVAGVVSRDGAHVEVVDSRFVGTRGTIFSAYRKNPEYGEAELRADGVSVDTDKRIAKEKEGGRVWIDGEAVGGAARP